MMEIINYLVNDYTFQIVALGTGILGCISGVVGTYVTLRKESLLGDTLSHAALPGIGLMFMLIQQKLTPMLLIGAVMTGILAVLFIQLINQRTVIKLDGAMALILSSFFGLGLVLLTFIQGQPNANQAGLSNFIFGQASAMLRSDVRLIITVSLFVLAIIFLLWKPLKLLTFDSVYAKTIYPNIRVYNLVLSLMIVLTIMIGLESVGVILISSLLVGPSIAARQWTNKLSVVMVLSGLIGAISGIIGTIISSLALRIPTGPSIVVVLSLFIFFSLLFAPNNGFFAKYIQNKQRQRKLMQQLKEDGV